MVHKFFYLGTENASSVTSLDAVALQTVAMDGTFEALSTRLGVRCNRANVLITCWLAGLARAFVHVHCCMSMTILRLVIQLSVRHKRAYRRFHYIDLRHIFFLSTIAKVIL